MQDCNQTVSPVFLSQVGETKQNAQVMKSILKVRFSKALSVGLACLFSTSQEEPCSLI